MRVALVHDWLVSYGGAEKVLEVLHELYPEAPVYTSVYDSSKFSGSLLGNLNVKTSFIQHLPFAKKGYRNYLPLMPMAFEKFDLSSYDIVISSSHACAKGVITPSSACHICYCHTPMRYIWDMYNEYLNSEEIGLIKRLFIPIVAKYLRLWDVNSSKRVNYFIANSNFVAKRIEKYYHRESTVINPPVETEKFTISEKTENYYLVVSRLVPQKKTDIIIKAFNELGFRLKIIGEGRHMKVLKKIAKNNIEFLENLTRDA